MEVQVKDALTRLLTDVGNYPIALQPQLFGHVYLLFSFYAVE